MISCVWKDLLEDCSYSWESEYKIQRTYLFSILIYYRIEVPKYLATKSKEKVIVTSNPSRVRPFVVAAILRNVTFNDDNYQSFIDLQDKLHQNVCRMRSLVSIGTHDLDTVSFPVHYDAKLPKDINFVALNQKQSFSAEQLMEFYSVSFALLFPQINNTVFLIRRKIAT